MKKVGCRWSRGTRTSRLRSDKSSRGRRRLPMPATAVAANFHREMSWWLVFEDFQTSNDGLVRFSALRGHWFSEACLCSSTLNSEQGNYGDVRASLLYNSPCYRLMPPGIDLFQGDNVCFFFIFKWRVFTGFDR